MKVNEIRQKSIVEIKEALKKARKDIEKVSTDILLKKEKNVKKMNISRKHFARLKTILKEKEIIGEK